MAPDVQPLRRLGGGRWQTRDGRFTIDAASGRWVVVDAEQTDELGLPRVRGIYESLAAARGAIDELHDAPLAQSPLPKPRRAVRTQGGGVEEPSATWLAAIRPIDRTRAVDLHAALEAQGVPDPATVVTAELTGREPAVASALVRRRLEAVLREAGGDAPGGRIRDPSVLVDAVLHALDEPPAGELPGWSLLERPAGGGLTRAIRLDTGRGRAAAVARETDRGPRGGRRDTKR